MDLCLTDPDSVPVDMPEMPPGLMETHHKGHAFLWITAGAVAMLIAQGHDQIAAFLSARSRPGIHRRRMVATLLHVARAAGPVRQSTIDRAFEAATGDTLGPNEAAAAHRSCFLRGAPTLAQILSGVEHAGERRALVRGATAVWMETGMDSVRATVTLDAVMDALGLTPEEVAAILDPTPADTATRVLTGARRVATSCLTSVTRLRAVGE